MSVADFFAYLVERASTRDLALQLAAVHDERQLRRAVVSERRTA
jgi:hypothetical protein